MTIVPRLSFAILSGFVEKCYLTLINIIALPLASYIASHGNEWSYILLLKSDPTRHRASISLDLSG